MHYKQGKIACILVIFFALAPSIAQANTLEVSGWIPYWRVATGTSEALSHIEVFTELNPFVLTMKSNGTLSNPDALDTKEWFYFASSTKNYSVRFIPTVMWSDGVAIHATLSNTTKRRMLASEIADLVKKKNWDGIDIDFENKRAETRPFFSLFLKGLQQKLGSKKWLMCTIEARTPLSSRYTGAPPKGAGVYANDLKEIGRHCDRVRIMAYDQGAIDVKLNAGSDGPYIPIADVRWVEKSIRLMMNEIPKAKISIGVPTYGAEYEVTPLGNGKYSYDKLWSFNPQYAAVLASEKGISPSRNQAGELSFTYATTTTSGTSTALRIVWWSDAQAIEDKVLLAKKLGVRGVSIFKIDGGADQLMWSMLQTKR